jgi:hypothetical protein
MCTQVYIRFKDCTCQLRYRLDACEYGPGDPRCPEVKKAGVWAGREVCHHHLWVQKHSAQWAILEAQGYRRMRPKFVCEEFFELIPRGPTVCWWA